MLRVYGGAYHYTSCSCLGEGWSMRGGCSSWIDMESCSGIALVKNRLTRVQSIFLLRPMDDTHKSEHHPSPSTLAQLFPYIIWKWVGNSAGSDPDKSSLPAGGSNSSPVGSVCCDSALRVVCNAAKDYARLLCGLPTVLLLRGLRPLSKFCLSTVCEGLPPGTTQKGVPNQEKQSTYVTFIGFSFKFSVIL